MKTRTVEVREGELLGPVDPDYDWSQHAWGDGRGGMNPECIETGRQVILRMAADPDGWVYVPSGISRFRVIHIGMWDGWPFWRPTPAIGYIGPLRTVEWAFFYSLREHNVQKGEPGPRWDRW